MKNILLVFVFLLTTYSVQAQMYDPVKWNYSFKRTGKTEGVVSLTALIQSKWHIYSQRFVKDGPSRTSFSFKPSTSYRLVGKTIEPKSISKYEEVFKANVNYFEKQVTFQQKINLTAAKTTVKGTVEYMACTSSMCLAAEEMEFEIVIK